MRTNPDDGGCAFPTVETDDHRVHTAPGMSLRDYFAGKALGALFNIEANPRIGTEVQPYDWSAETRRAYAEQAYHLADAMIAARNQKPE